MRKIVRFAVLPIYVLMCLALGGSAQGIWSNAALQFLGVFIIAWALLARTPLPLNGPSKFLAVIVGLAVLLIALQLIPLPPGLWSSLPGRRFVAEGFTLLGMPLPWMPISLVPYETMVTLLTVIPPLGVLCAMILLGAYRASWLVVTILVATLGGILIGALQVSASGPAHFWYFYEHTNLGAAVGFFANSNHMAALLVVSVPLYFALLRDLRDKAKNAKGRSAILVLAIAGAVVLLLGIVLNGSLAVLLLGPPVLLLSTLILFPRTTQLRRTVAGLAALGAMASVAIYMSPLHDRLAGANATSIEERQVMWSNTARAIPDFMPLGSGVSSYGRVYHQYEDPSAVTRTYTPHAHNEYLEIVLETGVPGALLLTAFLLWWASRTRSIWRSPEAEPYAQAATLASGALLLHSVVEYPLRTAALSAVMAICLALMARPREREPGASADLWPTRHVRV